MPLCKWCLSLTKEEKYIWYLLIQTMLPNTFTICDVLVHIAIACIALLTIFFTFGLYIEHKVTERQLSLFLKQTIGGLPSAIKKMLLPRVPSMPPKTTQDVIDEDKLKKSNQKYIKLTIGLAAGLLGIVCLAVGILHRLRPAMDADSGQPMSWGRLVSKLSVGAVITFVVVGLTEMAFAGLFVLRYISVDMAILKSGILTGLD